ncbi:MAG: hypothetical protein V2B18_14110, partial [Pseudomonadota bacterium]
LFTSQGGLSKETRSMEPPKPVQTKPPLTPAQLHAFVMDFRRGMSDTDLAEKYDLSQRRLGVYKAAARQYIYEKKKACAQPPRVRVNSGKVLEDINSGIDNAGLQEKYNLTERQLQVVFRKMIQAGLVTPMQLASRLRITQSQVTEAFVDAGITMDDVE